MVRDGSRSVIVVEKETSDVDDFEEAEVAPALSRWRSSALGRSQILWLSPSKPISKTVYETIH